MSDKESARDVSEFEAESTAHLDALYGLALRLTRRPTDAEDLVQEAYLRAFRFRDHYTPGTNLRAWMFKILTNLFINRYRRSMKETALLDGSDGDSIAEAALSRQSVRLLRDPEAHFEAPLFGEQVCKALERLPADFRAVVVLSDVEEFSYKEIAEIVGCPIGTVMSRLHRARRSLQRQLVEYAHEVGALAPGEERAPAEPTDLASYRARRGAGTS
ncbi:MAG: sigma-70 family RNA polymerase sigma factor [Deltaproteobacteria bacterium]|nr:sigma-70 family RNA polymerase sigma factor [Deltaproteobacteria bacterium]